MNSIEIKCSELSFASNVANFCSNLSSITIQCNNPIKIFKSTISNCKSIKIIDLITTSTIDIFNESFKELANLNRINLKGQKITIGENCLIGNLNDFDIEIISKQYGKSIIKSESDIIVGKNSFSGLDFINSIELIGKVINIKKNCFNQCKSLNTLKLIQMK